MNRVVSYTVGLLLALALTGASFGLVFLRNHATYSALPFGLFLAIILTLAMVQLAVQLIFFLHLGQEKESQWSAALFCFTFFGILVVVIASVWIMYHLNTNMTPRQVDQYIIDQSSF